MHSRLIDPQTLDTHLKNPGWRALDCRANLADPAAGRRDHETGHIPGAHFADLETQLSGPLVAGHSGRHPLPDRAHLRKQFGHWGIAPGTQIVVYDAGNGMFAARAWWLARWLGHEAVAVLDGGLAAWQDAGLPVTPSARSDRQERSGQDEPESGIPPYPDRAPLTRTVSAADLLNQVPGRLLLDARGADRFKGDNETIDPIAGHIPGADNAPFTDNLDPEGRFLSGDQLRAGFADLAAGSTEIVCYCGSGVTATHNIMALLLAGYDEPALYPGSWSEWIQDPCRPLAR